jgi:hypothetical protein
MLNLCCSVQQPGDSGTRLLNMAPSLMDHDGVLTFYYRGRAMIAGSHMQRGPHDAVLDKDRESSDRH